MFHSALAEYLRGGSPQTSLNRGASESDRGVVKTKYVAVGRFSKVNERLSVCDFRQGQLGQVTSPLDNLWDSAEEVTAVEPVQYDWCDVAEFPLGRSEGLTPLN